MKKLLIIGARGYGREICGMAKEAYGYAEEFLIKGFLDDNATALDSFEGYPKIIDSVEDYEIQKNDVFICALGDVAYKKKYVEIIKGKGGEFINLIHKSAFIGANTQLGEGCIVDYDAHISCDVQVGSFTTFMTGSQVGHDAEIGDWSSVGVGAFIGGGAVVCKEVAIHTGSIILPKKKIENNSVVAAGAVVIRNVKEFTTVVGNPAKKL